MCSNRERTKLDHRIVKIVTRFDVKSIIRKSLEILTPHCQHRQEKKKRVTKTASAICIGTATENTI